MGSFLEVYKTFLKTYKPKETKCQNCERVFSDDEITLAEYVTPYKVVPICPQCGKLSEKDERVC